MNDSDAHESASTAAASIGMAAPDSPLIVDGTVKRYHDRLNDSPGKRNGWYIAHHNPDGTTGGTVGSHKLQVSCNWCTAITRTFTPAEKAEFARKQAEARSKAEAERLHRQVLASARADRVWKRSGLAYPLHPYLTKKKVKRHRARMCGDYLIIDYRNVEGKITTLQYIKPNGDKCFLTDGVVKGSSHRFGPKVSDTIICCEGWATGATLYEATGHPVCVCGSAGNIAPVTVGIREKYPAINIIICGDADPVGRKAAFDAAELVGGVVCLPDFSAGAVSENGN